MTSLFDSKPFREMLKKYSAEEQNSNLPPVVDLYKNPLREKERKHLNSIFERLPDGPTKSRLKRSFLLADAGSHLGAWAELMLYDWLDVANMNPRLEPVIPGSDKTPDFLITSHGQKIYVEVFAVQRSYKDEKDADEGIDEEHGWWPAATATFRSMGSRLDNKISKYAKAIQANRVPFVVCVFLATYIVDLGDVKTYFLGSRVFDPESGELHQALDGTIFEQHETNPILVKHRHVSGVLVAKRNRATIDEGYKLNIGFIQNPYTLLPVSSDTFGNIRRFVVISESDESIKLRWL